MTGCACGEKIKIKLINALSISVLHLMSLLNVMPGLRRLEPANNQLQSGALASEVANHFSVQ